MEELPYKIIPGDIATYRERLPGRAIVGERIRMTMGMPMQELINQSIFLTAWKRPLDQGYQPPLINIVRICMQCLRGQRVSALPTLPGCLAHPCREICPKSPVASWTKAYIDQEVH